MNKIYISTIIPVVVSIIFVYIITVRVSTPIMYVIMMLVYILAFYIAFDDLISNIFILSLNNIFQIMMVRDLIMACIAISLHKSLYDITSDYSIYTISFILQSLVMFVLGILFGNAMNLQMVKTMLANKRTLRTLVIVKGVLTMLMVLSGYVFYYRLQDASLAGIFLVNRSLINACFYCLLALTSQTVRWIEKEVEQEHMQIQLEYQKKLYRKQTQCEELLRMYNHDYKGVLKNSAKFLGNGDIDGAIRLLQQADVQIEGIIDEYRQFSNCMIIDIILSSLEEKCTKAGIEFNANCYIPENVPITELEFNKIFDNLSSNAFEACEKQGEGEKRWINFKSYVKDNKLIIYEQNSFDGVVIKKNDRLVTRKMDYKLHGIGLESMQYTIDGLGGMMMYKANEEDKIFEMLIKIPLHRKS